MGFFKMNNKNSQSRRSVLLRVTIASSMLAIAAACASPEERVERYAKEGAEYLEKGDLGRANVQFQNALKINEEHLPSLQGMSRIAEKKQDFEAMFAILQRIVRLDPSQDGALVEIGQLYLIGSDEASALEFAQKALDVNPDNIDAVALQAGIQLKLGDYVGAVNLARSVTEKEPGHPEAVSVLATERALEGDHEGALAELDKALAANSDIPILQLLRIRFLTLLERPADTRAAYEDLIEAHPDEKAYRRAFVTELVRQEDLVGARGQLEKLVELEPRNLQTKLDIVRVVRESEGVAEAERVLRSYVDANPENMKLKFALVDFLRNEGDTERSNAILSELAADDDQDVVNQAKNKIATFQIKSGDIAAAQQSINDILAGDPLNSDALLKRAGLFVEAEAYDEAIGDLRSILSNNPDNADAILLMASAFEQQGNMDFARGEYSKAFEASNRGPRYANALATFSIRQDNYDRAEEVLVQSLATAPGDVDNLKLLAAVRLTQQDWRGAEEVGKILETVGQETAVVDNILTAAYSGLEEYDRIIETLTARAEEQPLASRPLTTLITAYMRSNQSDEAENTLERIIEGDPKHYDARVLLAQVLGAAQRNNEAEAVLVEATSVDPMRAEAFELLYRYFLRIGENGRARTLIDNGLATAPTNTALRVFKADIHLSDGEEAAALALYDELIKERPNDRIIANNFVSLSSNLRTDAASVRRALEVATVLAEEENAYFRDTVGWARYRAGDYEGALRYLRDAAEKAPGNAEILYHLGSAQLAAAQTEEGRATLQNALAAGGQDFRFAPEIRSLLQQ